MNGLDESSDTDVEATYENANRSQNKRQRIDPRSDLHRHASVPILLRSSLITLNVGGKNFQTTIETLTAIPNTYFTARLQNKFLEDPDKFIDRDPTYFRYILNYLRDRHAPFLSTMDESATNELKTEAHWYGLTDLEKMCEDHQLELEEQKRLLNEAEIRRKEMTWTAILAANPKEDMNALSRSSSNTFEISNENSINGSFDVMRSKSTPLAAGMFSMNEDF